MLRLNKKKPGVRTSNTPIMLTATALPTTLGTNHTTKCKPTAHDRLFKAQDDETRAVIAPNLPKPGLLEISSQTFSDLSVQWHKDDSSDRQTCACREKVGLDFPLDLEVSHPPYLPRNRWRHIRNRRHHLGLLSSRIPGKDR